VYKKGTKSHENRESERNGERERLKEKKAYKKASELERKKTAGRISV
jgi:hypothetical protein